VIDVRFTPTGDISDVAIGRGVASSFRIRFTGHADNAGLGRLNMKGLLATALLVVGWFVTGVSTATTAPCLIVTLTGTQGRCKS
jgi:hypothetical protein